MTVQGTVSGAKSFFFSEDKSGPGNDVTHIGMMNATVKESPAAGILKRAKQPSQRGLRKGHEVPSKW